MAANHSPSSLSPRHEALFIAALRHSRRVRFFKALLPLVAVAIAAAFSWFTFFSTTPALDVVNLNAEGSDDRLVMTQPKVEGYTRANKPYSLSAARAVHEPGRGEGMIELEAIAAQMPLGERGAALIEASSSVFDNINGRMRFDQPFTIETSNGLRAHLQSADVNVASSQLVTRRPVKISQGGNYVQAGGMQVLEGGRLFIFDGGVRLFIDKNKNLP